LATAKLYHNQRHLERCQLRNQLKLSIGPDNIVTLSNPSASTLVSMDPAVDDVVSHRCHGQCFART
jgi:hypothetical protein